MKETSQVKTSQEMQVVVFKVGREEYCVEISNVREIIRKPTITHMPNGPAFLEGIINIRGVVVPVVDLRSQFRVLEVGTSEEKIIIVDLRGNLIGMVVDEVTEVLRVDSGTIEPPPQIVVGLRTKSFKGVAKLEQRLVILLDAERVLVEDPEFLLDKHSGTEKMEVAG